MIRHATTLLLLILLALTGCAKTPTEPRQITVMTYNIHHAEGTDGKLDLERIAGVIRSADADFVALQEVDVGTKRTHGVNQARELGRLTRMRPFFSAAMPFQGGQYGNAILSRFSTPSGHWRAVQLPHQPGGRREPRAAVSVAIVELTEFISTHLDHTPEPSDRLAQAEAINRELAREGDDTPAILAGDFNCTPDSPPMVELLKQWTLVSGGGPSIPSSQPSKSIDHVLVRPAERWRVVSSRVIDEPVASDHRPVVVTLELLP
jgi:endonuclease/exonuclease/phosphatase family metal-dependent hydrolase